MDEKMSGGRSGVGAIVHLSPERKMARRSFSSELQTRSSESRQPLSPVTCHLSDSIQTLC